MERQANFDLIKEVNLRNQEDGLDISICQPQVARVYFYYDQSTLFISQATTPYSTRLKRQGAHDQSAAIVIEGHIGLNDQLNLIQTYEFLAKQPMNFSIFGLRLLARQDKYAHFTSLQFGVGLYQHCNKFHSTDHTQLFCFLKDGRFQF